MASSIKLQKRVTQGTDSSYRLQVWVSETSDNIPSEIFMHRSVPIVDAWPGVSNAYYGVCSYADLINYAADGNDGSSSFYRKQGIDLIYKSAVAMDETWDQIVTDTQQLVNDIVKTYSAVATDVSYAGTNLNVTATVKHYDDDAYSYLLDMTADQAIFVVEHTLDGTPELVSIASLADMSVLGETERTTGYYRVADATLAFTDEATYTGAKASLDINFAKLDTDLTDPGTPVTGDEASTPINTDIVGPTVYYF